MEMIVHNALITALALVLVVATIAGMVAVLDRTDRADTRRRFNDYMRQAGK